jgi:hypothetical protein
MVELVTVAAVAVIVVLAVVLWRRVQGPSPAPRRAAWEADGPSGERVVLDLVDADPKDPAVERLVNEAGLAVLARDRALDEVEVVARDGAPLGRVRRPDPLPADVTIPAELREPHAPRRHGPSAVPQHDPGHPRTVAEPAPEVRSAPLADRLDLHPSVRARIDDPDRASEVVRAILEASGRSVTADGDLLVCGDVAIAIVDPRGDAEQALNHGFLRIQSTDATRGLLLRLGYVDPALTRRREAAAPHVRHVGTDALQRMADAAAAGADPIRFAGGPVTVR